jgi:uncharacterized membrane protein
MEAFLTFIGRLHPLIVHLPIGFILLALLIEFYKKYFKESEKFLKFILFWTIISGFFSLISGYLQYQQEGYLWETVQGHFYFGIFTLLLSIGFYFFLQRQVFLIQIPRLFFSLGLLVSLLLTGHLGGSVTHGEDHLTKPLKELSSALLMDESTEFEFQLKEENFRDQPMYASVIAPILSQKCISCHNPKKTKGELQMHTYQALQIGGKNGSLINYEDPKQSELFLRIHLPKEDKKHMPPKSKKQLTKAEIKIISHWIEIGAPEKQTLGQLGVERHKIDPFIVKEKENFYPEVVLETPDLETLDRLFSKNILISPVTKESNLLNLSVLNYPKFGNQQMNLLEGIKQHLVSIDLSYSLVNDSIFYRLAQFPNLVQIKLNHTQITGEGISQLNTLKYLKKLYLVETALEGTSLPLLLNLPAIEQVFVYQSKRNLIEEIELTPELEAIIEIGTYALPRLASDAIVY